MSKEVSKHLKVTHSCNNCNSVFIRNIIVGTPKDFKVSDLSFATLNAPERLKNCLQCNSTDFNIKYSFYHVEKIAE